MEVTDDKTLPKSERKQMQIGHARHLSIKAWAVKFADKTCNLEEVAENTPRDRSLKRRQEYFDWSKNVVDELPEDMWPELKIAFDRELKKKPSAISRKIKIAMEAHKGVTDKVGNPYALHPLKMMSTVNSEEEKIIALLHDVVEDAKHKGWNFHKKSWMRCGQLLQKRMIISLLAI